MSSPPTALLNEYQQRHFYSGLVEIDKLLSDITRIAAGAGTQTLFPRYIDDLTLPQRRLLADSTARLRTELARALAQAGMQPQRPRIAASGAIRTTLIFAEIAAEELGPGSMRGYGELTAEHSKEIEGVVAQLRQRCEALLDELSPESAAHLDERIAQLADTPQQRLLAEMERLTRAYGLVEFRPGLALATERMAAPAMEVAVFGRVSCGKSSLLNYLLGADILPMGVTPITAVPTSIGYGEQARVTAQIAGKEKIFTVADLAGLASEQHNPNNRMGVRGLRVDYPSPRLQAGVRFVDTPGLGSIRSWGALETLAYLPRCDMAILLVDAGATLGAEELELAHWLDQGGVPVQVLLSKADQLQAGELEQSLGFTREALAGILRPALPLRAVSVRNHLAALWFEQDVLALYRTLRQRFLASIGHRLTSLRDGMAAALQASNGNGTSAIALPEEVTTRLERRLQQVEAEADHTLDLFRGLARRIEGEADAVTLEMAAALRDRLEPGATDRGELGWDAALSGALGHAMVAHSQTALVALAELSQAYIAVLREAARLLPNAVPEAGNMESEFEVRDLPMPEVGSLGWEMAPPERGWLGRGHAERELRRQLQAHRQAVGASLYGYGELLQQRGLGLLQEMRQGFHSRSDLYRAALQRAMGGPGVDADSAAVAAEVEKLRQWRLEEPA